MHAHYYKEDKVLVDGGDMPEENETRMEKKKKIKLTHPPKINIRTVHGVKGQTCDTAIMVGFKRFLWNVEYKCKDSPGLMESYKSFFTKLINVAATRARSYLAFMHFGPENDVWWAFNSLKKSKTIEI